MLQRQGGEQREAHDHAAGDHQQRQQIAPVWALLAQQEQDGGCDQPGDAGAGKGEEGRFEGAYCDPRRRQRAAEDEDAEKAAEPAAEIAVHICHRWIPMLSRLVCDTSDRQ
ncbi:hypothetical protein D3C81_939190 [compost metagenome]